MAKPPASRPAVTKKKVAAPKADTFNVEEIKVGDEDAADALSVPAYFTTSTLTMYRKGIIRIAFGEGAAGKTRFHGAIAMSLDVATSLAGAITELVEKNEELDDSDA